MCKQNSEANIPNQVNGVGFIRSRKSMDKVNNMCEALVNKAEAFGVKVLEVIVDDGGSQDIDRDQISRLCTWMENSCVNVIFVCRITDVTMDMADLENFLIKAFNLRWLYLILAKMHLLNMSTITVQDVRDISVE